MPNTRTNQSHFAPSEENVLRQALDTDRVAQAGKLWKEKEQSRVEKRRALFSKKIKLSIMSQNCIITVL